MKNNKLIATFLKLKCANNYHDNFDLLMAVVEKIENTNINGYTDTTIKNKTPVEFQFTVEISGPQCLIHRDMTPQYYGSEPDFLNLYDCRNKSKIAAVYSAVISFIKWYNVQKKLKCFNNSDHIG